MTDVIRFFTPGDSDALRKARVAAKAAGTAAGQTDADAQAVETARQQVEAINTALPGRVATELATQVPPAVAELVAEQVDPKVAQTEASRVAAAASAQNAASMATVNGSFTTFALANAALASLAEGHSYEVTADGANNGIWTKRSGVLVQTSTATMGSLDGRTTANTGTSGELIGMRYAPTTSLGNGASALPDGAGNAAGLSVAAGQTGLNSFITSWIPLTPDEIARMAGRSYLFTVVYSATAGFLTDKPISSAVPAQARRPAATTVGAVVSTVQVGTTITRVIRYTPTAADTSIGVCAQIGSTSIATAHALLPVSVSYQPDTATGAADDVQVDRVERLRRLGLGSVWDQVQPAATAGGGAALLYDADNRPVGMTIPIGQTGAGAFVRPRYIVSPRLRAWLTGRTIRVRAEIATSAGLARVINATLTAQLAATAPSRTVTSLLYQSRTNSSRIIEFSYVCQGDELELLPTFQQAAGGANAVAIETWQITDLTIDVVSATGAVLSRDELNKLARDSSEPPRIGMGVIDDALISFSVQGTSAQAMASATGKGISFPATVSDGYILLQARFFSRDYDLAALTGRIIRWTWTFTTSAGFTRLPTLVPQVSRAAGSTNRTAYVRRRRALSSTRFQVVWTQAVTGDELAFFPYMQFDPATSPGIETIEHASLRWQIVGGVGDLDTPDEENQRQFAARQQVSAANLALSRLWGDYKQTVGVRAAGGSDFATISAALAALDVYPGVSKATAAERIGVIVQPGEMADGNIQSRSFVDVLGEDRRRCRVLYLNPDNVAVSTTRNNSVFDHTRTSRIRGLTMICRNARYTVHIDDVTNGKFTRSEIEDCNLTHLGNDGAIAYQTGLGGSGDPSNVWGTTRPLGLGSADGQSMRFSRLALRSWKVPVVGWHSNGDFSRRATMLLEDSHLISDGPAGIGSGEAVVISCNDARELNTVILRNLSHVGRIRVETPASLASVKNLSPFRDTDLTATGIGGPVFYATNNLDRVLRIATANTTSAGSVALSGTALPYLFGTVVQTRPGGGGLAADAYGDLECGIVSIETRMGAHGGSPVTLTVTIDGAAPVSVTFTGDYSASGSGTVLGEINAALGAAGTAGLFNAFALYRANVPDQQDAVLNVDTVGVDVGVALAWTSQRGSVRRMTSADAASLFAGFALERMVPNAWGRVQSSGYITVAQDVVRSDGAAFVMGDTFEIGATAGRVQIGSGRPILTATNTTEARIIETGRLFA